jgi:6-phosphogluconolactonase/glucosamine-6-phosphate isomerase/deaminase
MNLIHSTTPTEGIAALAGKIRSMLERNKKVLWLVPGGSNIPIANEVMRALRKDVLKDMKTAIHLTVTLTDERYGSIDHPDSNWKQLENAGFDFEGINIIPVLTGVSLQETVENWERELRRAFKGNDLVIGQFGIGPDGHIAGMLPNSPAAVSLEYACGYQAEHFVRITMTAPAIKKVHSAFVFAYGSPKTYQLERLQNEELTIEEQPAQVLKSLREVQIYCD